MQVIAVASSKGGTGKSCVAAYTGLALAQQGMKTLLLEQGQNARTLDLILGVQDTTVFDCGDVFSGVAALDKAAVQVPHCRDLFLLAGSFWNGQAEKNTRWQDLIEYIKGSTQKYDYVIIDGADFTQIEPSYPDTIVLVVTPDTLCVRSSVAMSAYLYGKKANNMRMIINDVPPRVLPIIGAKNLDDVIDIVGVQLLGVVPQSPKLQFASNNAQPVDQGSITGQVFERIAQRLQGQLRPLLIN